MYQGLWCCFSNTMEFKKFSISRSTSDSKEIQNRPRRAEPPSYSFKYLHFIFDHHNLTVDEYVVFVLFVFYMTNVQVTVVSEFAFQAVIHKLVVVSSPKLSVHWDVFSTYVLTSHIPLVQAFGA